MQQHSLVPAAGNRPTNSAYAAEVRRSLSRVADEYERVQLEYMTLSMENERLRMQLASLSKNETGDKSSRASPSKGLAISARSGTMLSTENFETMCGVVNSASTLTSIDLQFHPANQRTVSWEPPSSQESIGGEILNEFPNLSIGLPRSRSPSPPPQREHGEIRFVAPVPHPLPIEIRRFSAEEIGESLVYGSTDDSLSPVHGKGSPQKQQSPNRSTQRSCTSGIKRGTYSGKVCASLYSAYRGGPGNRRSVADRNTLGEYPGRRSSYENSSRRSNFEPPSVRPSNRRTSTERETYVEGTRSAYVDASHRSTVDIKNAYGMVDRDASSDSVLAQNIKFGEDRIEYPSDLHNTSECSEETSSSTQDGGSLFPLWFDPGDIDEQDVKNENKTGLRNTGCESDEEEPSAQDVFNSERRGVKAFRKWHDPKEDHCVLSPVGRPRMTWDLLAVVCLLLEAWTIPFDLIFLEHVGTPVAFDVISHCITVFFGLDIVLNFTTGYIDGDHAIMNRADIFHHYLKLWFWIDVLATIPWDLVLSLVGGSVFSFTRVGKASRFVRTLRYIKFLRAARLIKSMKQTGELAKHFTIFERLRIFVKPTLALCFLIIYAHLHGCIWAAFQPTEFRNLQSSSAAIHRYFDCFTFAFLAVTCGFPKQLGVAIDGWQWTAEMLIASERIFIMVLTGNFVVYSSLKLIDDAREDHSNNNILTYLRRNYVSLQKQVEVGYSLKDIRDARKKQHFFDELLEEDLPKELLREVAEELFGKKLLSLGLIAQVASWHNDFIIELAQIVREETFPSRTVLFEVGHQAITAHCIIVGELIVVRSPGIEGMPNFTKGMWVGENALVSATLRRSATIVTRVITSVMTVPGDGFQNLVSALNLMHQYQEFCTDHLWRGICGRCGILGDHFSDGCHIVKKLSTFQRRSTMIGTETSKSSPDVGHKASIRSLNSKLTAQTGCTTIENSMMTGSSEYGDGHTMSHHNRGSRMTLVSDEDKGPSQKSPEKPRKFLGMFPTRDNSRQSLGRASASRKFNVEDNFDKGAWKELRKFLAEHNLMCLTAVLLDLRIYSLTDLHVYDKKMLLERLKENGDVLTQQQQSLLSSNYVIGWRARKKAKAHTTLFREVSRLQHLIFLSHYKMEAGTEAALMRTELEFAISESPGSLGQHFDEPVFLDSENLNNLEDLTRRVRNTHNLVILLTKNILTRPWCLLEIITARREGLRILLVNVSKPGNEFIYPDELFYEKLTSGNYLDESSKNTLQGFGCSLDELAKAIRSMFQNIAVPYSPHKAMSIRKAEIGALLKMCKLKGEADGKRAA